MRKKFIDSLLNINNSNHLSFITQHFNQSTLQPINASTNQHFNQSTLQPINTSTSQHFNQSTLQPVNASTSQRFNHSKLVGYKVVFVPFSNGRPSGQPEDFLTGFITGEENKVYGRPAGVAFTADGSLLVADDASNTIWRVSVNKQ